MSLGAMVAVTMLTGCATVFRGSRPPMRVETEPLAAEARLGDEVVTTPAEVNVPRRGATYVTIKKDGYADHRGLVRKRVNPGWVIADIATCVFPVALCIPLVLDAVTGAWIDVERQYMATLEPTAAPVAAHGGHAATGIPTAGPASTVSASTVATVPRLQMSESERKAAARAAFMEGVQLQDKNNHAEALSRFIAAQRLFDAPTHLLHIAQCLAKTGKLIEAQETYEMLARRELAPDAAEAFRDAQDVGKKELAALHARIPTIRIQMTPAPSSLKNLAVQFNGLVVPNELIGIARPLNPGVYRVTAGAVGYRLPQPVDVDLKEGTNRTLDLKLEP